MNEKKWISRTLSPAACLLLPVMLAAQNVDNVTLKQAVERSLRNSREVAEAQVQYDVSRNTVTANRAAFRPNLYTGSGIAYSKGFPQTPSGAAPTIVNLSYVQTVFNPQMSALVQSAAERSEGQRLELERVRNAVMLETGSSYLELAKVRHSLELMRNERQSNARILNFTRQRVTEGLELPIEITRAELVEARTEQKIVQLETRQRALERRLAGLMGMPADQRFEIESVNLPVEANQRELDVLDRALAHSFDLRQAEQERRARQRRLEGEIGSKWPTVDVVGSYGLWAKFNHFQDFFNKFERNNVTVGLQIKIPLLTAQQRANVALARSELTAAEMTLKTKRQTVELDASSKYQRLRELNASREVTRLELRLAQEDLQMLQARFQEGRVNLREVELARIEENARWLAFLDSDYERQKAQLELLNTTGNLGQLLQ